MTPYLFILGRTPELSFLELQTILQGVRRLRTDVAIGSLSASLDVISFLHRLGGTVKIARVWERTTERITGDLFLPYFTKSGQTFGMSVYGDRIQNTREIVREIKEKLRLKNIAVRFVEGREGTVLSSVTVEKNKLREFILAEGPDDTVIAETIAVQNFEDWNTRDYGRPHADPGSGMLPPKVARMIVNLACFPPGRTLLDPFCGMGTILGEALLSGWDEVIGSDQSIDATRYAKENLDWLKSSYPEVSGRFRLLSLDATHISAAIPGNSISAIVTEPYMGPSLGGNTTATHPNLTNEHIKNIIKGLEKLYIGCLRDWYSVLKPGGKIVMAFPRYHIGKREYFVKRAIDRCEMLGYTIDHGPIEYSRPQATVRREFFVFTKR
ncbi:MAG: hypothetical protein Q7S76_02595 [bacterium]|nr:hypothetical protein [bacterium]